MMEYNYNKILTVGNKNYKVYVTSNRTEIKRGLMYIENIPNNWGILFHYKNPGFYGIWMKDTWIPLDVIWIDENKKIVDKKTLLPNTEIINYPKSKSKYILEVNGNTFDGEIGDSISLEDLL